MKNQCYLEEQMFCERLYRRQITIRLAQQGKRRQS